MSDSAAYLADAWVSLCAALGALIVLIHLQDLTQRPQIALRFRFSLWLLVILMLARVANWGGWGWVFSAATAICAALVPLAALLLAEGFLRRHAPATLKQICGWGAVGFSVLGLVQFGGLALPGLAGLMVFQLVGLGGVALFVLRRDKGSLSPAENGTIDRMSLSFLVILPFLATDFMRGPIAGIPVRLGGVAVLVLCWLAIGLNRPGPKTRDTLRGFGIVLVATGLLTLILSALVPMDLRSGMQVMAVTVSTLVLLAIWHSAATLRAEDRQFVALQEMASATGTGPGAGLRLLRRAAGAPDATLITEDELADMNLDDLRCRFATAPVQQLGTAEDEQVNWLLARFDATHAVLLSADPFRVVMLNSPDIAAMDGTTAGLRAVQRMAAVLTAGGAE